MKQKIKNLEKRIMEMGKKEERERERERERIWRE